MGRGASHGDPGRRLARDSHIEASNLLEQQRQGVITRQFAAWAAILAVPTAIAGIYGMNFANMPGDRCRIAHDLRDFYQRKETVGQTVAATSATLGH